MKGLTLTQEMGRQDPDLTPAHDVAMFWLEDHLRDMMDGLNRYVESDRFRPRIEDISFEDPTPYAEIPGANVGELESLIGAPCPRSASYYELVWEHPLANGQLFLDMVAFWSEAYPTITRERSGNDVRFKWGKLREVRGAFICEVKPRLFSIGEALRQLKRYAIAFDKDYGSTYKVRLSLVAPEHAGWKRVLEQEGFGYINLPPPSAVPMSPVTLLPDSPETPESAPL